MLKNPKNINVSAAEHTLSFQNTNGLLTLGSLYEWANPEYLASMHMSTRILFSRAG
jgi:hypothetical protein